MHAYSFSLFRYFDTLLLVIFQLNKMLHSQALLKKPVAVLVLSGTLNWNSTV